MTAVFLANSTVRYQDVHIRLPERKSPIIHRIPPGMQIKVSHDFNTKDLDALLVHGKRYGWTSSDEVDRSRRPFSKIVYSLNKSVAPSKAVAQAETNQTRLEERGREIRKTAAVAINQQLENQVKENRALGGIVETDVHIIEDDNKNGTVQIAEGLLITRAEDTPPEQQGNRSARGKRGKKG